MDSNEYINKALIAEQQNVHEQYAASQISIASGTLKWSASDTWTTATTIARHEPSIADRIEDRLTRLQGDIDRLKRIKKQLSEPNGVLSMSQSDFEFLLRY